MLETAQKMNVFSLEEKMGIIHASFYGKTPLSVFEEYLQHLKKMELSSKIKILYDHQQSTPVLKPSELDSLAEIYNHYLAEFKEIKLAYVSSDPLGIALAMLLKDIMKTPKYNIKIFSEKETAIKWLNT